MITDSVTSREVMTVAEAADFLRLSVSTLHQRKDIPRHMMPGSKQYRYLRSELLVWLVGDGVAPVPASAQLPEVSTLAIVDVDKTVNPVYHRSTRYR